MLNNTDQIIQDVNSSTINQAAGNVVVNNYGLSTTEVVGIVRQLISSDMSVYRMQAERTAQDRFNEFAMLLEGRIDDKISEHLDRFNEPSIQLAARDAALGYVRNGNSRECEILVNLLIERVLVTEHSTTQKIIDQAIRILPNLSNRCLALITFLAFIHLKKSGKSIDFHLWNGSLNPVIDVLKDIEALDIAYLQQVECATVIPSLAPAQNFLSGQKRHADLFYRHPASEKFNSYVEEKYNAEICNGELLLKGTFDRDLITTFISTFDVNESQQFCSQYVSSSSVVKAYNDIGLSSIVQDIHKFMLESIPFTEQEVKNYFLNLNPNWQVAFDLMERSDIRSARLSTVGNYIACHQLSVLTGHKVDLNIFYQ